MKITKEQVMRLLVTLAKFSTSRYGKVFNILFSIVTWFYLSWWTIYAISAPLAWLINLFQ